MFLSELPKPDLAPLAELHDMCMHVLRATNPTQLGYSYEELKGMDDISITIMPEKKGMVFKHVEYLVESRVSPLISSGLASTYQLLLVTKLQALKSSVRRRYKDFEAFDEALLSKYPYRLIPRMPPKKLTRKYFIPS